MTLVLNHLLLLNGNKFKHMKNLKSILVFITFLCGFNICWAQQDFKSVVNDSIAPDGFLYHKLLANDSFKSLSHLYNISKGKIKRLNPLLRRGFKLGMIIKLPANDDLINLINKYKAGKEKNKYIVQHQDTKYGISKRYGISINELERLNPKIRLGLKVGDTLFVPKIETKNIAEEDDNFLLYQIEKDDTFYSLNKKYNVTKDQLIFLNPNLSLGLKVGEYIRIPKIDMLSSPKKLTAFTDSIKNNTMLNVLFLLPFKSNLDSVTFNDKSTNSKLRNIVTDLYFGAELALDSISKQGVTVNAQVFDTENDINTINQILYTHDFSKVDLVIGPLFTKNIAYINKKLVRNKTYILSPFSTSTSAISYGKSKIVQETPTQIELTKKIVDYVATHYNNENLVLVTDGLSETNNRYKLAINRLSLNDSINLDSIKIISPTNGYIKKEILLKQIDTITKGKNWVLNLSSSSVLLADVINNLGVLPKESYNITMFTVSQGKLFNNFDNNFLARLNFCFPTDVYTNYNLLEVKKFDNKFIQNYHSLPTESVYKGFDIVYDALARLARRKKLINKRVFGVSRRTSLQFDYEDDSMSHKILNKGVFLLKYDGLAIKLVE